MASNNNPVNNIGGAPDFDSKLTEIYEKVCSCHLHPNGAWTKIIHDIQQELIAIQDPKILDLAAGNGAMSKLIAVALPSSHVISTDVSESMNEKATEIASSIPNMEARIVDMLKTGFDDNGFDAITCCFGYHFPSDNIGALKESWRILKPGGVLLATIPKATSSHVQLACEIMKTITGSVPDHPILKVFAEPGSFEDAVKQAGFIDNIKAGKHSCPLNVGSDEENLIVLTMMTERSKLEELSKWKEARELFGELKHKYVTVCDGDNIINNLDYEYIVAKKPTSSA